MRLSFVAAVALVLSLAGFAEEALPRMTSVDPQSGKKGAVVAVTGENLQKSQVEKVFLTDGKNDTPVEVTEQTATTIKFKIPDSVPPGERLAVMILTAGKDAKYIEQPVKIMIEQ